MSELENRVEERFGVLPNFFRLAPETPEIIEKLWGFAQAAYLDNPLPSVFKERLFVHLSRFCAVRYCIARHVGFLVGLGRPAGDPTVRTQSVADVVKLLRRPFPRGQELQSRLSLCAACPAPIVEMPMADTQMEDAIFVLAAHVFLKTSDYLLCLDALARLLVRFAFNTCCCSWRLSGPRTIGLKHILRSPLKMTSTNYWQHMKHWRIASSMTRRPGTASASRSWTSCQPYASKRIKRLAYSPRSWILLMMRSSAKRWMVSSPVGTRVRSGCSVIHVKKRLARTSP